jgi:transmembrane sensor
MKLDIGVLKRYFSGKYSRNDFELIRKAIESDDQDRELKSIIKEHWNEFDAVSFPDRDVDNMLDKIHHFIHLEENRESRKFAIWNLFQRVAAVLFLPLALSFLLYHFYQPSKQLSTERFAEIQCPPGVRTNFGLPDGTTGYLNSGSKLRYDPSFRKTRQVELIGEAYFDVANKNNSPFIVQTRDMKIKVLGTTFNVIAYADEKTEEVILESGALSIYGLQGDFTVDLSPNQKITLHSGSNIQIEENVISSQYTSWKQGKLVFRNEAMEKVARRLSRWYNAEIIIADKELYQYSFYATFQDEPLDEVLKLLALTTPILIAEETREISRDGVYSKRKIILKVNPERIDKFR